LKFDLALNRFFDDASPIICDLSALLQFWRTKMVLVKGGSTKPTI